jgi:hypothetical protein
MKLLVYVLRLYSGRFALVIEDGHCGGVGGISILEAALILDNYQGTKY